MKKLAAFAVFLFSLIFAGNVHASFPTDTGICDVDLTNCVTEKNVEWGTDVVYSATTYNSSSQPAYVKVDFPLSSTNTAIDIYDYVNTYSTGLWNFWAGYLYWEGLVDCNNFIHPSTCGSPEGQSDFNVYLHANTIGTYNLVTKYTDANGFSWYDGSVVLHINPKNIDLGTVVTAPKRNTINVPITISSTASNFQIGNSTSVSPKIIWDFNKLPANVVLKSAPCSGIFTVSGKHIEWKGNLGCGLDSGESYNIEIEVTFLTPQSVKVVNTIVPNLTDTSGYNEINPTNNTSTQIFGVK